MTARSRRDPAVEAEAYGATMTVTEPPQADRQAAARYIARRARDADDEQLLLAALGLDQPPA
ncbi:hypothetical protein [Streptomyces sp. Y1]|uniref:Uncharacterized protein n=1 Tax=Streptomyces sp. Y1 TaxID=3238634 RepID=A0AB39TJK3_9ACTN